jgi:ubiquinone/menaquinone biosynthesis C-methylase UbiE
MAIRNHERKPGHEFAWKLNEEFTQHAQKFIYRYATRRLDAEDVVFLNYGYEEDPPMGVPLSASDEPNRFPIQLYHRTATQADLDGKRVLEVGCGHGGGASYIMRTLHPGSYVGLDLNPTGIAYCQKRYDLAGLEFVQGDAEDLPFPDGSFDAVINVESSHLYPRFPRFLDEVARVLRADGQFLYTDARSSRGIAGWESALANAPLQMVSQRAINAEVVRGMEKNLQQWQNVIDRVAPVFLRGVVRGFAPARRACEDLKSGGSTEYRMYCFVK